jgi:hypothetical protein
MKLPEEHTARVFRIEVTYISTYTGHTQKNGAVLIVNTIKTAPFFCVCPVYVGI